MKKVISAILAVATLLTVLMLSGCAGFIATDEGESIFISEIKKLGVNDDGEVEIAIYFTDEEIKPVIFTIPPGKPGEQGEDGNGILGIKHEHDDELDRTKITLTFTDTSRDDEVFYVKDGLMVESIKTVVDELTQETCIYLVYNDGSVSDAIPLPKGDPGVGIESYDHNVLDDQSVEIAFLLSNGNEFKITIPPPQTGNGIESMTSYVDYKNGLYVIDVAYTNGTKEKVSFTAPNFWYNGKGEPDEKKGVVGDYYFDINNKVIYNKVEYDEEVENDEGEIVTVTKTRWDIIVNFNDQLDKYDVSFYMNDGSDNDLIHTYRIKRGTYFNSDGRGSIPIPVREGYKFVGWYTQRTISNPQIMSPFTDLTAVFGNLKLYAIWEPAN